MIRNGCYTVVNPKTGGNRTIRIRQLPKNFGQRPGTRFAEFLGEKRNSANPAHHGGDDTELVWIGFAFINADQVPVFWTRFRGPDYVSQRAALKFIFGKKGEGYLPWFESNFKELYGGTPIDLDKDNPNPTAAAIGVAADAWERSDEQ